MRGLKGLADKSADFQSTHGQYAGAVGTAGDHYQRRAAVVAAHLLKQAGAGAVRQIPITNDQLSGALLPFAQGRADAVEAYHVAGRAQAEDDLLEQIGDPAVIFQNHDAHACCLSSWLWRCAPGVRSSVLPVAGDRNSSPGHGRSRVVGAIRPVRAAQCLRPVP